MGVDRHEDGEVNELDAAQRLGPQIVPGDGLAFGHVLREQCRDAADGREVDAAVAHAGVDDGLGALSLPDAGGKPRVHELGRREIHAACRRGADAPERAACGCWGGAGVEDGLARKPEGKLACLPQGREHALMPCVAACEHGTRKAYLLPDAQLGKLFPIGWQGHADRFAHS